MESEHQYKEFTEKIDTQSEEMMKNFNDHLIEVKQKLPNADKRGVFESWAIQKRAGLQVVVQELSEDNEKLRNFIKLKNI